MMFNIIAKVFLAQYHGKMWEFKASPGPLWRQDSPWQIPSTPAGVSLPRPLPSVSPPQQRAGWPGRWRARGWRQSWRPPLARVQVQRSADQSTCVEPWYCFSWPTECCSQLSSSPPPGTIDIIAFRNVLHHDKKHLKDSLWLSVSKQESKEALLSQKQG